MHRLMTKLKIVILIANILTFITTQLREFRGRSVHTPLSWWHALFSGPVTVNIYHCLKETLDVNIFSWIELCWAQNPVKSLNGCQCLDLEASQLVSELLRAWTAPKKWSLSLQFYFSYALSVPERLQKKSKKMNMLKMSRKASRKV